MCPPSVVCFPDWAEPFIIYPDGSFEYHPIKDAYSRRQANGALELDLFSYIGRLSPERKEELEAQGVNTDTLRSVFFIANVRPLLPLSVVPHGAGGFVVAVALDDVIPPPLDPRRTTQGFSVRRSLLIRPCLPPRPRPAPRAPGVHRARE